jgi:aspartate/tyrosine/aromatic aminotransferase
VKEYDEFGNLIKYDSIYSWSYSNIKGDRLKVNLDSIMDSFKAYFDKNPNFKLRDDFTYFPKNDSLFMSEFFKDDYFYRNWQTQHAELEKMIKRMDSSRNSFLKQLHPGLMESKDKIKP